VFSSRRPTTYKAFVRTFDWFESLRFPLKYLGGGRFLVSLAHDVVGIVQVVCLVRVQRNRKKVVDPENYRSSNLISDDCREGVLGQIPGLNPASFRLEHLS